MNKQVLNYLLETDRAYQLTGTSYYGKNSKDIDILVYGNTLKETLNKIKNDFKLTDLKKERTYTYIIKNNYTFKADNYDFIVFTNKANYIRNVKVTKALKILDVNEVSRTVRHLLYEKGIELTQTNPNSNIEDIVDRLRDHKQLLTNRIDTINNLYEQQLKKSQINKLRAEFDSLLGLSNFKDYSPAFKLTRVTKDHLKFTKNKKHIHLLFNRTTIDIVNKSSNINKSGLNITSLEEVIKIILELL
jgi:tRNA U38,U39,U40 pseudouridine synthase TruA